MMLESGHSLALVLPDDMANALADALDAQLGLPAVLRNLVATATLNGLARAHRWSLVAGGVLYRDEHSQWVGALHAWAARGVGPGTVYLDLSPPDGGCRWRRCWANDQPEAIKYRADASITTAVLPDVVEDLLQLRAGRQRASVTVPGRNAASG